MLADLGLQEALPLIAVGPVRQPGPCRQRVER